MARAEAVAAGSAADRYGPTPGRVGYVVRSWPRLSQTFIVQEILELERLGVDIEVFTLSRAEEQVVQPDVAAIRAPVHVLDQVDSDQVDSDQVDGDPFDSDPLDSDASGNAADAWRVLVAGVNAGGGWAAGYHAAPPATCVAAAARLVTHLRRAERDGRPFNHLHAHFAHDPAAVTGLAAAFTGTPWTFTAHARDLYQLVPSVIAERVAGSDAVVTICRANVEYLAQCTGGRDLDKIRLIHNGLDLDRFTRGQPVRPPGSDLHLVSVGRLVEKKGFADLVAAVALVRHRGVAVTCDIYGEGPQLAELLGQIDELELGSTIRLLGAQPRPVIIDAIRAADVFALTPYVTADGDRDGIPTVLVEAMACCVPVVSTDVVGVTDLVESGVSGFVTQPRHVAAIADALIALVDPARRAQLGAAARRRVETHFDGRRSAEQLLDLFGLAPPAARRYSRVREGEGGVETFVRDGAVHGVTTTPAGVRIAWEFPHDPALPGLAAVLDPVAMTAVVRRLTGDDSWRLESVEVMRFRAGRRCTLAASGEHRGGPSRLITKVFHDAAKGRAVHDLMVAMAWPGPTGDPTRPPVGESAGVPPAAPIGADALGFDDESATLFQSWVEGEPLDALLTRHLAAAPLARPADDDDPPTPGSVDLPGSVAVISLAEEMAATLAAVHRLVPPGLRRRPEPVAIVDKLAARSVRLAATSPAVAAAGSVVIDRLRATTPLVVSDVRLCLVHGDVKPAQFVARPRGGCALLDFDHGGLGDPAHDVASALAAFEHGALGADPRRADVLARAADVFLAAYLIAVGSPAAGSPAAGSPAVGSSVAPPAEPAARTDRFLERVGWYTAAVLLRKAHRAHAHSPHSGAPAGLIAAAAYRLPADLAQEQP